MKNPFNSKKNDDFQGVSIIVTTDPTFVEAKAAPNVTAVDVLNAYGTVTALVLELLTKIGINEDVIHSSMDYAHNQAMAGIVHDATKNMFNSLQ